LVRTSRWLLGRLFEKRSSHLDEPAALQRLAEYWAQAPLMKCAYDPEDCSEWPSPWEMIYR
jgi:hypothetical protein